MARRRFYGMLTPSPIATDLLVSGIPLIEKGARAIVVYVALVGLLRIAGKRTLGSLNSFDLVVLLLLSNTVQNAIVGNDNSLVGGLFGAVVLIAFNYFVVWFLYTHHRAEHAIEGGVTLLIHHGKFMEENMRRQLITRAELQAAARRQGIYKMSEICTARLETGGAVTFDLTVPSEQDRHFQALSDRLDRIEAALARLNGPTDAASTGM